MKLVLRFLKPYRRLCGLTILAMLLDVAGGLIVPRLTADMINIGIESGSLSFIIQKGLAMLAATLAAGAGALLGSWLCADLSAKIGKDMRNAVYEKSLTFSDHDFDQFGTGSMITRTLNDINIIQQSVVWCIQMVLPVPAVCVMGIAMAFAVDQVMGFLLIGVTLLIVILAVIVTRRASEIFGRLQRLLDRMNVVLRENLTGVRVIRAFRKERDEEERMRKSFEDYAETSIRANLLFAGLESTAFFVINICIVAILWFGGNRIGAGYMQIGDITALTEYSILILFYIIMAQMVIILLPRARVCIRRVSEVLEKEPGILDGQVNRGEKEFGPAEGLHGEDVVAARFLDVSFRFPDADEYALKNLSFSCKRGETTAVIGGTGSGKSTLVQLIGRFYDVTKGRIKVFGTDVKAYDLQTLREQIGMVPQRAVLFRGTIRENLKVGKEDATDAEMQEALKTAQALEVVEGRKEGLDAMVSEGGKNLSGGQRQRLTIARALVRKPRILILDDSASALDFATDARLRKALQENTEDMTVFLVSQRVSSLMHADRILVLEDGEPAGMGTHEELLKSCQVYREICRSQLSEKEVQANG